MCTCSPADRPADPTRRHFLAAATLAAVGGLLASACQTGFGPSGGFSGTFTFKVTDYPALATVGGIALIDGASIPLAAVRSGTSSFIVLSRVCPHQGFTIGVAGSGFQCPGHGAQFDNQGTNVGGFPAGSMQSFSNTYDAGTGVVTVTG